MDLNINLLIKNLKHAMEECGMTTLTFFYNTKRENTQLKFNFILLKNSNESFIRHKIYVSDANGNPYDLKDNFDFTDEETNQIWNNLLNDKKIISKVK